MQGIRTDAFNSMRTTKLIPHIALESLTDRVEVSTDACGRAPCKCHESAFRQLKARFQSGESADLSADKSDRTGQPTKALSGNCKRAFSQVKART